MAEGFSKVPGIFVDRDGTLIKELGYLRRLERIEILPGVPEDIQLLRQQGLKVAVRDFWEAAQWVIQDLHEMK